MTEAHSTDWWVNQARTQSYNHLLDHDGYEYFGYDENIVRAPLANPMGLAGYRQGARFYCLASRWEQAKRLLLVNQKRQEHPSLHAALRRAAESPAELLDVLSAAVFVEQELLRPGTKRIEDVAAVLHDALNKLRQMQPDLTEALEDADDDDPGSFQE